MATGTASVTVTYNGSAAYPQHLTNKLTKITVNGHDYVLRPGKVVSYKLLVDLLIAASA